MYMDYNNTAQTYTSSTGDTTVNAAAMFVAFTGLLIFAVISYAITAFLLGRVFKKAGVPQWAAWVPIYNTWKLLEMGDQPGFWSVLSLLPFVGILTLVFMYIAMYHIGLKLGKEKWFVLLAIFVPIVWMIWLGFDDSKWPVEKKPAAAPTKATPKKKTTRAKKSA